MMQTFPQQTLKTCRPHHGLASPRPCRTSHHEPIGFPIKPLLFSLLQWSVCVHDIVTLCAYRLCRRRVWLRRDRFVVCTLYIHNVATCLDA